MGWDWTRAARAANDADRALRELDETARRDVQRRRKAGGVQQARDGFYDAIASAWPPGFFEAMDALQRGDRSGLELILDFLEAYPRFFRSGYQEQRALRFVKRVELRPSEAKRLRAVVLDAIRHRHTQNFRRYCSLARALDDDAFRRAVAALSEGPDDAIRQHARWVLDEMARGANARPRAR